MKIKNILLISIFILSLCTGCASAESFKTTDTSTDYYIDNGLYNLSVSKTMGTIQHLYLNGSSDDIISGASNTNGFGACEYRSGTTKLWCRNVYWQPGDCTFQIVKNTPNYIEINTSIKQRYSNGDPSDLYSSYRYVFVNNTPYFYMKVFNNINSDGVPASDYSVDFITKDGWMQHCWYNNYTNVAINYTTMRERDYIAGNGQNMSWMFAKNDVHNNGFALMHLSGTPYSYYNALVQPDWGNGDEYEYSMSWFGCNLDKTSNSTDEFIVYPTVDYNDIVNLEKTITKSKSSSVVTDFKPYGVPFGNDVAAGNLVTWMRTSSNVTTVGTRGDAYAGSNNYLTSSDYIYDAHGYHDYTTSQVTYKFYNNSTCARVEKCYSPVANLSLQISYEMYKTSPYIHVTKTWTAVNTTSRVFRIYDRLANADTVHCKETLDTIRFNNQIYDLSLNTGTDLLAQTSTNLSSHYVYWCNESCPDEGIYFVYPNTHNSDNYKISNSATSTGYDALWYYTYYNTTGNIYTTGQQITGDYWILNSPGYNISSIVQPGDLDNVNTFNYYKFDIDYSSLTYTDFTVSNTQCMSPAAVKFNYISYPDSDSTSWDFENDGIIDSIKQNPVHTYGKAGTYSVNLTVRNEYGNFSTVKSNYITVSAHGFASDAVAWFNYVFSYLHSIYLSGVVAI